MKQPSAADFVAIHQLIGLYGQVVDGRQWHRIAALFAEDGVFDMTAFGVPIVIGPAAIGALWASQTHPLAHHATNIVIAPIGARRWQVVSMGFGHWPDGTVASCVYRDVVRRGDDGYRFAARQACRGY